ncbi:hypothetical protein M0R04_06915 [Candidatus Dojkabacteria bacterium]|jgi:hypothetical protein|nr:hypothetical protein [Candidatus Dojkabacteria bacterium]
MKLTKIIRLDEDISNSFEDNLVAKVSRYPWKIDNMQNPTERVQLAAVLGNPLVIDVLQNPTQKALIVALKSQRFINEKDRYERLIRRHFADNTLLMKKWLRYGEAMRES